MSEIAKQKTRCKQDHIRWGAYAARREQMAVGGKEVDLGPEPRPTGFGRQSRW